MTLTEFREGKFSVNWPLSVKMLVRSDPDLNVTPESVPIIYSYLAGLILFFSYFAITTLFQQLTQIRYLHQISFGKSYVQRKLHLSRNNWVLIDKIRQTLRGEEASENDRMKIDLPYLKPDLWVNVLPNYIINNTEIHWVTW